MIVLEETWVRDGDEIVSAGDSAEIDHLLTHELEKIAEADNGWRSLYRHRSDGRLWQLDYPHSELHGGGPRRLADRETNDPATWK